ncbi:MAG TPA: hypothetical protein DEO95_04840 [Ruminococcaceae bacterium]|nr:hypothetical protein [Oscillospiraceae bacterium]
MICVCGYEAVLFDTPPQPHSIWHLRISDTEVLSLSEVAEPLAKYRKMVYNSQRSIKRSVVS